MARSAKQTPTQAATPARAKRRAAAATPVSSSPAKSKSAQAVAGPVVTTGRRGRVAAGPVAVAPTRVPPPSKGELRAHIEKLEVANAALKAKGREVNRAAKIATRRIAELEEQVTRLEAAAAKVARAETTTVRRGRSPGPQKAVGQSDAVPQREPVQDPASLDEEAAAASDVLDDTL